MKGRRATITGLHYSTAYRVWAGDATFDFATAGPPDSPAASIGGGAILLDGQPYFPLIVLALCPVSYPNALAFGITLYAENGCGGIAEQTAALAGKAFSLTEAEEAGKSGPGVIGWYYPDEADLKGITAETLPSFPPPETTHRLRVLTVTNHFYSRTATLAGRPGNLPGTDREIGRRRVRPLPAAGVRQPTRGSPPSPTRNASSSAWRSGRPTFQWIEAQSWKRQQPALRITPAVVRAESWLSVAGGARGIGFFPGEWDPSVVPAVEQISKEVAAIGGGLLAPDSPASATGPSSSARGASAARSTSSRSTRRARPRARRSPLPACRGVPSECWRRGEASRRRVTRSRTRSPRSACTSTS